MSEGRTARETAREVIAWALGQHFINADEAQTGMYPCRCGSFSHDTPEGWNEHRVDAICDTLAAAGLVVVPREPTDAMVKAARRGWIDSSYPMWSYDNAWKYALIAALSVGTEPGEGKG